MNDNPRNWSDDEIRYYFDSHPNLRMQHLARMTGKSMYELKRILMPGRRQAGGGAGVTVALSGSWRRGGRTNLRPDFVGEMQERKGQSGKLQGNVTVEDVSIASYENSADVKGVVGQLKNVTYSPNDLREYYDEYKKEVERIGLSVRDIRLVDVEVSEAPNVVLSKGWTRAKAPNSFEVEVLLQGGLMAGDIMDLGSFDEIPATAMLVTSTKFKDAYNHIDDWDEMDVDDARYMSASAERVASRFMEACGLEKGSGGLLFRFGGPRDGLYIQTVPSDPPYNQTYSAATTMSGSGKMALRALSQMWADPKIRRELMRHKRTYEVMDDIDNRLRQNRVRGRLRWHQWHMPD